MTSVQQISEADWMNQARRTPGRLLLTVWRIPACYPDLPVMVREVVLDTAFRAGMMASFAERLIQFDCWPLISQRERDVLDGMRMIANEHCRMLRWEVDRVHRALMDTGLKIVLLKGAAFDRLGLPNSAGRLVADLDILADRADLKEIESCFNDHGWHSAIKDDYDQKYYRQWMHEIPPMRHQSRLTEVDVHHTILPVTSRLAPDPVRMMADAVFLPEESAEEGRGVWLLSPVDMTLHCVVHLFYDSDFGRGLRDLMDLDGLLRHFSRQDVQFWDALVERSQSMQLGRPLYYALTLVHQLVGTPVPEATLTAVSKNRPWFGLRRLMHWLIPRVLLPGPLEKRDRLASFAWLLLYIRSHWLRMPPGMLFAHLSRKTKRRMSPDVRNRRTI
ncbi:MAG: nucleotidyltransferase family protein [Magnetococcales bacterium]|nr:nucleotidyltransferase family protein [Magnetococcales bacterium]